MGLHKKAKDLAQEIHRIHTANRSNRIVFMDAVASCVHPYLDQFQDKEEVTHEPGSPAQPDAAGSAAPSSAT